MAWFTRKQRHTQPNQQDALTLLKRVEKQAGTHIESLSLHGGVWYALLRDGSTITVRYLLEKSRLNAMNTAKLNVKGSGFHVA